MSPIMTPEVALSILFSGFAGLGWMQVIENKEGNVHLDEGPYHKGEASLVRFHGVKG
jgi:hypothetical protein